MWNLHNDRRPLHGDQRSWTICPWQRRGVCTYNPNLEKGKDMPDSPVDRIDRTLRFQDPFEETATVLRSDLDLLYRIAQESYLCDPNPRVMLLLRKFMGSAAVPQL